MRRLSRAAERLLRHRNRSRRHMRTMRQRRRKGIKLLTLQLAHAEETIDAWIELGLLSEAERTDTTKLASAVAALCRAGFRALRADAATPSPAASAPGLAPDDAPASNSSTASAI
jgi:hypothetical protein